MCSTNRVELLQKNIKPTSVKNLHNVTDYFQNDDQGLHEQMPLLKPDVWYQAFPQKLDWKQAFKDTKDLIRRLYCRKMKLLANNSNDCYVSNASPIYSEIKV